MCNVNIFYVKLIFIALVKISYAFNNTTSVNHTEINGRKIIRKCCKMSQYLQWGTCLAHDEIRDFSNLKVYNKNIIDTNKSFYSMFTIKPGLFKENPNFTSIAGNANSVKFNSYIIEDGSLQVEKPNTYDRWISVQSANFCIDYGIMKSGCLTAYPQFWIVINGEAPPKSSDYLSSVSLISCVFLLLVLLVYILLPELQNLCGLILMAYVASLCMTFLLLAIIQLLRHGKNVCIGLTLGIYYFTLASFCWMTIMSYDIWCTFRSYAKDRHINRRGELLKFFMYCLCAFGVPLLMTIGMGVLNTVNMRHWPWFITPQIPQQGCFLEGWVKLFYLYTPMLILNICNWIFYMMTAFNLWRMNRATAILNRAAAGTPAAHRTQRHRFMVCVKLATVMGLNWLLEVISFLYPKYKVWYLTDLYNVLMGFFIFLIFVFKKKIYRKLYKRYITARNTRRLYPGLYKRYFSSSSTSHSNRATATLQVCSDPKEIDSNITSMSKT